MWYLCWAGCGWLTWTKLHWCNWSFKMYNYMFLSFILTKKKNYMFLSFILIWWYACITLFLIQGINHTLNTHTHTHTLYIWGGRRSNPGMGSAPLGQMLNGHMLVSLTKFFGTYFLIWFCVHLADPLIFWD